MDSPMDFVEEDIIQLAGHTLWKPPLRLTDCSSEYLKDNPIPYSLLKNPFVKPPRKQNKTNASVIEETERCIWSQLGSLKNLDDGRSIEKELSSTIAVNEEPSLYYAKSVPALKSSREITRERQAQKKARLSNWFDLPRGDLTQENKEDLEIISKRRILGLDVHTRKSDGRKTHFQVGTVADDPGSFYDRIPRKQRKRTLVDELIDNANYMKKHRRQYAALQKEQQEKRAAIRRRQKQQTKKAGKTKTIALVE